MGVFDRLFGKPSKNIQGNPEVNAVFEKIYALLSDENVQNRYYPAVLQQLLAQGGAIDQVPNASGEFGRNIGNPIPVNGFLGELVYISNLTLPNGVDVVAHRLGNLNNKCDIYEIVAIDGSRWDILIFDMYHTRKSRITPSGYNLKGDPAKYLFATDKVVDEFPEGISEAIKDMGLSMFSIPILAPQLESFSKFKGLTRPKAHEQTIQMYLQLIQIQRKFSVTIKNLEGK